MKRAKIRQEIRELRWRQGFVKSRWHQRPKAALFEDNLLVRKSETVPFSVDELQKVMITPPEHSCVSVPIARDDNVRCVTNRDRGIRFQNRLDELIPREFVANALKIGTNTFLNTIDRMAAATGHRISLKNPGSGFGIAGVLERKFPIDVEPSSLFQRWIDFGALDCRNQHSKTGEQSQRERDHVFLVNLTLTGSLPTRITPESQSNHNRITIESSSGKLLGAASADYQVYPTRIAIATHHSPADNHRTGNDPRENGSAPHVKDLGEGGQQ
jgi:hypothetical protein